MTYDIIHAWGSFINCHKCKRPILKNQQILQTKNMQGSYEYCHFCAAKKGYTSTEPHEFKPFDKHVNIWHLQNLELDSEIIRPFSLS